MPSKICFLSLTFSHLYLCIYLTVFDEFGVLWGCIVKFSFFFLNWDVIDISKIFIKETKRMVVHFTPVRVLPLSISKC